MTAKDYILQNARYHNFTLSDGTEVTPSDGHNFYPLLDVIFSDDMSGKTLLDIGCSNGFYTTEAAKRNAKCTGVESSPAFLKTASLIAKDASVEIDFINGFWGRSSHSLSESFSDDGFDIVLLMNVIHHNDTREAADYQLTEAMRVASEVLILCVVNEEDKPNKIYYPNDDIKKIVSSKFSIDKEVPYLEAGGNCTGRTIFTCKRL